MRTPFSLILLATLLLSLGTWPVQAVASVSLGGPADPGELGVFLDGLISKQLDEYHIPGAAVAVVKDGELFFAKGYGYANLEKRIPVVADQTLFRIGSTSKLFIWTAVMQLVEQGKLDLNADANTYLKDFKIPATYPQSITMLHLMSHTAGFEERTLGMVAPNAEAMMPLDEFLARFSPARVRPPGQLTAYSNYGAALAGYIVAEVSGLPFEQYVEDNIYKPLQMTRSTFRQPVPPDLASSLAVAYGYDGSFYALPFEYINASPGGAMSTTATDIARFMIAHLQDGRYGDARILQAATAQQMRQRLFANDPRLSGFDYGFFEMQRNHQQALEHGGGFSGWYCLLTLLPEHNLGVFIAYNSGTAFTLPSKFIQAFMDHYYPLTDMPSPQPPADFAQRANRYAGYYRSTRMNYTSIDRIQFLAGGLHGAVSANADGTLTLRLNLPGGPFIGKYLEIEPLVFQSLDGRETIIFKEDGQGHITHLLRDSDPKFVLEKIAWYDVPTFSQRLFVFCVVAFASALLAGVVGAVVNRWRTARQGLNVFAPRLARGLAFGISALNVLFVLGVVWFLANDGLLYTIPPYLPVLLGLGLVAAILTIGLVAFAVLAWACSYWSLAGRVHYTLVTLAAVAFVWLLNYWNLLGFRY